MKQFHFSKILQKDGWKSDIKLVVDESGTITSIDKLAEDERGVNYLIPGFQNAHSHAFQYGMVGMAEQHLNAQDVDDFWGWRESMYQLALHISPEELYAIARMLYVQMRRHGYTNVSEFHYVHHQKNGQKFDNLSEMGEAILRAGQDAGINVTLIPIFYQKGGFGQDPKPGQKRFISYNIEEYRRLLDASIESAKKYQNSNVAIGIHSMRGVEPMVIKEVAEQFEQNVPFHIHISEQLKEVEDSVKYLGSRPVEWFAENIELSERFHLVHATHLTPTEVAGIAKSKANVVLCPSTEGNLGDGIFPLIDYHTYNGNWSIGTDSHIGISPFEELRILDYGQRLISHKRNIMIGEGYEDSGRFTIHKSLIAGRKAMNNFDQEYFKVGDKFNGVVIHEENHLFAHANEKHLASSIIYSSNLDQIVSTIVNGEEYRNHKDPNAEEDFKKAMTKFRSA